MFHVHLDPKTQGSVNLQNQNIYIKESSKGNREGAPILSLPKTFELWEVFPSLMSSLIQAWDQNPSLGEHSFHSQFCCTCLFEDTKIISKPQVSKAVLDGGFIDWLAIQYSKMLRKLLECLKIPSTFSHNPSFVFD